MLFNYGIVVTAIIILKIIVLGVFTYIYYKNIFTTVLYITSDVVVYKEAGVQTEELDNTTSCEDITSVGSESAFPNLVDVDSVVVGSNYQEIVNADSVGYETNYPDLEDVDSVGSESDSQLLDLVNADDNFYDIADPHVYFFHIETPESQYVEYVIDGIEYIYIFNNYGIFSVDPAIFTMSEFWSLLMNHIQHIS